MLVKFEQIRTVVEIQSFELFGIFEKVLTPFWKRFLWHQPFFDAKVLIKRLVSLFAIRHVVQHANVNWRRKQKSSIVGLVTVQGFWMEFALP